MNPTADIPDPARCWGYARVSTEEQNLDLQVNALRAAGVLEAHIITDKDSGSNEKRPGYIRLRNLIRSGSAALIKTYRIDRLGRDQYELVDLLQLLEKHDCALISLCEPFVASWRDSSWAFRALWEAVGDARYELLRLRERQKAGIQAAHDAGKHLGRPRNAEKTKEPKGAPMGI